MSVLGVLALCQQFSPNLTHPKAPASAGCGVSVSGVSGFGLLRARRRFFISAD